MCLQCSSKNVEQRWSAFSAAHRKRAVAALRQEVRNAIRKFHVWCAQDRRKNGSLPVIDEVQREAKRRKVELIILPTREAMEVLNKQLEGTNAILHVTC